MTRTKCTIALVVAFGAIDAALFGIGVRDRPWISSAIAFGYLASQAALVATWLVFASSPSWPQRLSIVAVIVLSLSAIGASETGFWEWALFYGGLVGFNVLALTSLQIFGLRLVDEHLASNVLADGAPDGQITIRDIMILTAAAGVVGAATVYMPFSFRGMQEVTVILQFAVCFAAVTVTAVIAALAFRIVVLPAVLGIAVSAACGYALAAAASGVDGTFLLSVAMAATAAAVLIGVFWIYRGLGLRLRRVGRTSPPEPAALESSGARL